MTSITSLTSSILPVTNRTQAQSAAGNQQTSTQTQTAAKVQGSVVTAPQKGTAPDGDSAAVEAAESQSTKINEKTHGGFFDKHV